MAAQLRPHVTLSLFVSITGCRTPEARGRQLQRFDTY
jgi:hypothetical protein